MYLFEGFNSLVLQCQRVCVCVCVCVCCLSVVCDVDVEEAEIDEACVVMLSPDSSLPGKKVSYSMLCTVSLLRTLLSQPTALYFIRHSFRLQY